LEDLLKRRLTDTVVFKLMLLLELFDQLEKETNGLVVALDSQAHVTTVVLDDFNMIELVTHALNDAE
jgi:hypothetical protein